EAVPPEPAGNTKVQLLRTVPDKTYDFAPRGDFTILDAYLRALRSAKRLVYLENQFLWSPEIAEVLIGKLQDPPDPRFRVVLVLPRKPTNGADTTRGQLGRMLAADEVDPTGEKLLLATTINAHSHDHAAEDTALVYVHAKVGIVDDEWMTIGSANLNEHSLFNDTEANVVVRDPGLAREVRLRLWAEHLERPRHEIDGDPARVFDELWKPLAHERLERRKRDGWADGKLTMLPHVSRRSEALWGPLNGLLVDA
ncbi:MAG TPA: phospholipase D-like domain-containing protein, partial [Gaiellaceae bacterium]|nr:phospholipase D-like domain-containing protein [Gaiellaceae bacterium]